MAFELSELEGLTPGTKVRCIKSSGKLKEGTTYTLKEVDGHNFRLVELSDTWPWHRFSRAYEPSAEVMRPTRTACPVRTDLTGLGTLSPEQLGRVLQPGKYVYPMNEETARLFMSIARPDGSLPVSSFDGKFIYITAYDGGWLPGRFGVTEEQLAER